MPSLTPKAIEAFNNIINGCKEILKKEGYVDSTLNLPVAELKEQVDISIEAYRANKKGEYAHLQVLAVLWVVTEIRDNISNYGATNIKANLEILQKIFDFIDNKTWTRVPQITSSKPAISLQLINLLLNNLIQFKKLEGIVNLGWAIKIIINNFADPDEKITELHTALITQAAFGEFILKLFSDNEQLQNHLQILSQRNNGLAEPANQPNILIESFNELSSAGLATLPYVTIDLCLEQIDQLSNKQFLSTWQLSTTIGTFYSLEALLEKERTYNAKQKTVSKDIEEGIAKARESQRTPEITKQVEEAIKDVRDFLDNYNGEPLKKLLIQDFVNDLEVFTEKIKFSKLKNVYGEVFNTILNGKTKTVSDLTETDKSTLSAYIKGNLLYYFSPEEIFSLCQEKDLLKLKQIILRKANLQSLIFELLKVVQIALNDLMQICYEKELSPGKAANELADFRRSIIKIYNQINYTNEPAVHYLLTHHAYLQGQAIPEVLPPQSEIPDLKNQPVQMQSQPKGNQSKSKKDKKQKELDRKSDNQTDRKKHKWKNGLYRISKRFGKKPGNETTENEAIVRGLVTNSQQADQNKLNKALIQEAAGNIWWFFEELVMPSDIKYFEDKLDIAACIEKLLEELPDNEPALQYFSQIYNNLQNEKQLLLDIIQEINTNSKNKKDLTDFLVKIAKELEKINNPKVELLSKIAKLNKKIKVLQSFYKDEYFKETSLNAKKASALGECSQELDKLYKEITEYLGAFPEENPLEKYEDKIKAICGSLYQRYDDISANCILEGHYDLKDRFHLAAMIGDLNYFIDNSLNIKQLSSKNRLGETVLQVALKFKRTHIIKSLLPAEKQAITKQLEEAKITDVAKTKLQIKQQILNYCEVYMSDWNICWHSRAASERRLKDMYDLLTIVESTKITDLTDLKTQISTRLATIETGFFGRSKLRDFVHDGMDRAQPAAGVNAKALP